MTRPYFDTLHTLYSHCRAIERAAAMCSADIVVRGALRHSEYRALCKARAVAWHYAYENKNCRF